MWLTSNSVNFDHPRVFLDEINSSQVSDQNDVKELQVSK